MQLALIMAMLVASWTPPEEYHTEHFTFRYTQGATADTQSLARRVEWMRLRILSDLGRAPPSPTLVLVTATKAEFRRAQPGRPLPGWVAGVAYPRKNLIILGPPQPGARRTRRSVLLAHEYSHVALAHATRFRRLPTWFVEGFADLQALAPYVGDWRSWGGRGALPLADLHRDLGHDQHRASQSYQQSYDLVRFLRDLGDAQAFRQLIRLLAHGVPFDQALQEVYHVTTGELAQRWRRQWNWQRVVVPMVTSGLVLWVFAAMLLVVGYVRKRRERRAAMDAMEGDQDDEDDSDGLTQAPDDEALAHGGNGSSRAPPLALPRGRPRSRAAAPDDEELEASPVLLIGLGTVIIGTVMALLLTALLTLIWPHTRIWLLAGPAVVITFLGLRLMFRR